MEPAKLQTWLKLQSERSIKILKVKYLYAIKASSFVTQLNKPNYFQKDFLRFKQFITTVLWTDTITGWKTVI